MLFKERWMQQAFEKIKLLYPDDNDNDIIDYLENVYEKNKKDNKCILYNNYEKVEINTTIPKVLDWIESAQPILTESGSLFKQHEECWNPNIEILSSKLNERDVKKKEMFKYLKELNNCEDKDKAKELSYKVKSCDLAQSRAKVICNSEYGVSGLSSSWFFNMACASATTAKGQAMISTAMNTFEDFLSNNVLFENMDECLMFINNIVKEKSIRKKEDKKWINNKKKEEVLQRLINKFENKSNCDINIISSILDNLGQEDLNRLYYKSNLYEFILNSDKAKELITNIVTKSDDYLNPVKPPKSMEKYVNKLKSAILEYVHYNYPTPNRVYRLKNKKRKSVIIIDTDSNFLNLGPWVDFVHEHVINDVFIMPMRKKKNNLYIIDSNDPNKSREIKLKEKLDFKIINTMINIITDVIANSLDVFLSRAQVKNNPGTTLMKNEFLYDSVLVTPAKKHYQSAIRIQEGVYFPKAKFDVKGMEYMKKSMAGDNTRNFIENLIYNDILLAKDKKPDIRKILKKLQKFEDSIVSSVLRGDDEFIKTANIKTEDEYADPMSIGSYKAAFVWNSLYPDKPLALPGIGRILKVNLSKPKDFSQLSVTNPKIFERLMNLFENNERIKKSGINNIAIPLDEKIPKWIKPYINVDEIIENNTKLILQVLNSLGCKSIYRSSNNQYFSNIIDL